ncbi:TetR/AcrR family transcriptional regulator [Parasphingorhabdus sp.]|uniref:TetR/AcrR family transcriptional regulator n=1 Tax=Parasphingorhabdus sp. TaxID=2709688 RepID=UPI003A92284F
MMNASRSPAPERTTAKTKLIDAAHELVRRQGYAATSVDQICAAAGVTKGAFFHHFPSKEDLGVAAAAQWTTRAAPLFELSPYTKLDDPLERLLGHIDMRMTMIEGPAEGFTCFVGTMAQETFASSEALRDASGASISAYCEALAVDVQAAIDRHGIKDGVTAESLAWHVQAVLQGAFVIAKASGDPEKARESVRHLRRYIETIFN